MKKIEIKVLLSLALAALLIVGSSASIYACDTCDVKMRISPQKNSSRVYLDVTNVPNDEVFFFKMKNEEGKVMYSKMLMRQDAFYYKFDYNFLDAGVYHFSVMTKNKKILAQELFIIHGKSIELPIVKNDTPKSLDMD